MIGLMDGYRIGRLHRLLRHRAGLTQEELARKCGVGRWKIVQLEAGAIDELRFGDVARCFGALDGRLDVRGWYHGAAGDRLLDERHAMIQGQAVEIQGGFGWLAQVEVSFSDYGDRGSIDVLGWHPGTRSLAVEEVKSELGSIEGTLRPFDVKARLARKIALERYGWDAQFVGRILILPDDSSARRAVERHSAALNAVLPARSREVRAWLRQPVGNIGGIWFLSKVGSADAERNPSAIRRVRRPRPRS